MLWLALSLPEFPLQSITGLRDDIPVVLYETVRGQQLVYSVNPQARRAGIELGMTLASAQPLVSELQSIERQPERELLALKQLAQWAQQFTPVVSLQPPAGLLLEVESSLKVFHGIESLQQRVSEALRPLKYSSQQGVAPTPGGAWLLAQAGLSKPVTDLPTMQSVLRKLPVNLLPLLAEEQKALGSLGIRRIVECLRLPRAETGRRFGKEFLLQLDRIFGHVADPRSTYQSPEQFSSQILLPDAVQQTQPLLFILQRLLHELAGFLRARCAGAQSMKLGLISPYRRIEYLELGLLSPSADPTHLLKLWQEKLDRHRLEAPVEGLELQVSKVLPVDAANLDLLAPSRNQAQPFTQFLERLRNRLGDRVIQQLHCVEDHRPEKACGMRDWQPVVKKAALETISLPRRPLWLLKQPQRLETTPQGPWFEGPLTLIDGPERIEAGWWDGADERRDYYTASSPRYQALWIFQDIKQREHWFLHGMFG